MLQTLAIKMKNTFFFLSYLLLTFSSEVIINCCSTNMNFSIYSVVVFAAVITTVIGGPGALKCKGGETKLEVFIAGREECIKELYPELTKLKNDNTKEGKAKRVKMTKEMSGNTCVDVCAWKKQKLIKSDGTFDSAQGKKMVSEAFPKQVHDAMVKALDGCVADNKAHFKADKNCEGYKKFRECFGKKTYEVCEIKTVKPKK